MKTAIKTILCLVTVLFAFVVTIITWESTRKNLSEIFPGLESLTDDEDVSLRCRCAIFGDADCAVDNWGAICATGVNAHCWEYDQNCS